MGSDEYDIVIVGAGPAGCIAAKYLADDYKVLVLDRSKFPRNKVCGGALIEKSIEFLDEIGLVPPKDVFAKPGSMSLRYFDWDNDIKFEEKRKFLNVYRNKFDNWIFEQAIDSAEFSPNTKLVDFKPNEDGLLLKVKGTKTREIMTRYLIDASGPATLAQKKNNRFVPFYVAVQDWVKTKHSYETLDYILCSDITDYYIWAIPKGKHLLIGCALRPRGAQEKLKLFREKVNNRLNLPVGYEKREAWTILRPDSTENIMLTSKNVFIVGEAAGLISSSTGEGISFALRSGYYCAQALNENFEDPYKLYDKACRPLTNEVQEKIESANVYKDSYKRKKIFEKITLERE